MPLVSLFEYLPPASVIEGIAPMPNPINPFPMNGRTADVKCATPIPYLHSTLETQIKMRGVNTSRLRLEQGKEGESRPQVAVQVQIRRYSFGSTTQ